MRTLLPKRISHANDNYENKSIGIITIIKPRFN